MPSFNARGLLLRRPTELPARGNFSTPARLISILDEEAGDVFHLLADEAAADALAAATTPCRVVLGLRASSVSLAGLSGGNVKGRAYRLRVLTAAFDDGVAADGDEKRGAR